MDDDIEAEKQILSSNENVAYLSEEQLDFKNLEYGQKHQRVLFLYNNSQSYSCNFEFQNYKIFKSDTLTVNPSQGVLEPKSKVLITFTLI